MNMQRILKLSIKALRIQGKRLPNKQFNDDGFGYLSFSQIADELEAILAVMHDTHDTTFYVEQLEQNKWIVTRKKVNNSVRNNRHRNNRA